MRVRIYRRSEGRWEWCHDGEWTGARIEDCAATLPDAVYEALDGSIDGVGTYNVRVGETDYKADVE